MKTVHKWLGKLGPLLDDYEYQPQLTERLDALGSKPFSQAVVNEIVLWKVNRYAELSDGAVAALNRARGVRPRSHRAAADVVTILLDERGVDLPMASTLLRFRNPKAFQIIDRRAYRAVYGKNYPLYSASSTTRKATLYLDYLDALWDVADAKGIKFDILDRVLYVFDKNHNRRLNGHDSPIRRQRVRQSCSGEL